VTDMSTVCAAVLPSLVPVLVRAPGRQGVGKIGLEELGYALASLGYPPDSVHTMVHDADTGDGVGRRRTVQEQDGEARVDREEFLSLVARFSGPAVSRSRLGSIGRVIRAAEREVEADRADKLAGPRYARSGRASQRRDAALGGLRDLAAEAFPFAIVSDSYRISKLVDSYNPDLRERREAAEREEVLRRKRGVSMSRPPNVFGVEKVEQGTFNAKQECVTR
jgi:hypothetical protein